MTMTYSPVSWCGVYSGRCLPRRILAMVTANRPTTWSVASMTYQFCSNVPGLGMNVDIFGSQSSRKPLSGPKSHFRTARGGVKGRALLSQQGVRAFVQVHHPYCGARLGQL